MRTQAIDYQGPVASRSVVRILSWNVWARFGPWERRQGPIIDVLRQVDADIIGLQEVWATDDADQLPTLAEALGYHAARPADARPFGFGNAVLSRWPIEAHDWSHLPAVDGPENRTVLHTRIGSPFGPLPFFTTHLEYYPGRSAVRCEQVATIANFVAERRNDPATGFPPVLCGDFNAVAESDEIRRLTGLSAPPVEDLVFHDAWSQAGDRPGITWSQDNPYNLDTTHPRRRIDYVFVGWPRPKPLGNPTRAWLVGTEAIDGVVPSDHFGVAVELAATA